MRIFQLLTVLFAVVSFSACGSDGGTKKVPAKDFAMLLENLPGAQLIDVRTPEEFAEKHLKNAININYNSSDFKAQIEKLDKSKPIMVYCLSGGRSSSAAKIFEEKGFKEVFNLEGGIMAWNAEGLPVLTQKQNTSNGMGLKEYTEILKKDKLVLVDFNAVWCGPCKLLKPILKNLEAKNKNVKIWPIDVDKNAQLSSDMHIKGIPLIILYKQGKEVWRSMGFADEATIQAEINKFK